MYGRHGIAFAGLVFLGVACAGVSGAEDGDWQSVLAMRPPSAATNVFPRWMSAVHLVAEDPDLTGDGAEPVPEFPPSEDELALARAQCKQAAPALAAFALQAGECAQVPPGYGMGRGLPEADAWLALARLKSLHVRVSWWNGRRATATAAAVDLIRAGTGAARDATQLRDWVTWMQIAAQGYADALWIARQLDVTDDDLATLSRALGGATGAWPDGAANALRGEFNFGFRGAVEHLPDTENIAEMLNTLADFGTPRVPEGGEEQLGVADGPLLDREATLALCGEAIAKFIRTITDRPIWQYATFSADFDRRSELWLADIGVFGELALSRRADEYPADKLGAIGHAIRKAGNPVGKLLTVFGATNFDSVAFEGLRVEANRRCTRLLVEWRRRILRSEELPVTAAAWEKAGLDAAALEDPFTGVPLFFDADKLRIWSVGLDGIDNHGTGDPRASPDGADFWWSLEGE